MVMRLWTDGSAIQRAGGGFVVLNDKHVPVIMGKEDKSTNIRMEGMALICALAWANDEEAIIQTDSQFWIDVLQKYAPVWIKNDWTKKGGPIKNLELVKLIYSLYKKGKAEIVWVKGHSDDKGNEAADEWANRARHGKGLASALLFDLSKSGPEDIVESIKALKPREKRG
ncbi:ribonuclease HI [Candidatus Saccharibacteria bacterium]|nr:ribonuclease HI [Candidatus Saccharibacteria bacterium]